MTTFYYVNYEGIPCVRTGDDDHTPRYRLIPDNTIKGQKTFDASTESGINYRGHLGYKVVRLTEERVHFQVWFSSDGVGMQHDFVHIVDLGSRVKKMLPSPCPTNRNTNGCKILSYSYNDFFNGFLDNIGESWSRFSFDRSGIPRKSMGPLVISTDYIYKRRNLKGMEVTRLDGTFYNKAVVGKDKEEFILCKFKEDVGGSSLDGASQRRDHLFLPKSIVTKKGEEDTISIKKKGISS